MLRRILKLPFPNTINHSSIFFFSIPITNYNYNTNQKSTKQEMILISKKLKFSKQVPKCRYWITHNRTRTKHNSDFSEIKTKKKNSENTNWLKNLIEALLGGFTFIGIGAQSSLENHGEAWKIHFRIKGKKIDDRDWSESKPLCAMNLFLSLSRV